MDLTLTSAGRRKVNAFPTRKPGDQVLAVLHEHGSLSVREMASLLNTSTDRVRSIARKLHRQGYVRVDES